MGSTFHAVTCSEGTLSCVLPYFVMSQRPVLYSISSKKLVRLNQTKVAMTSLKKMLFICKILIRKPKKTLSDNFGSSAGEGGACEVDEASKDGASPKPSEFDKPLVQDVLRVSKIAPGCCACLVVADHADQQCAEDIDADAVRDVQSIDDLATHVYKHHDNHLKCVHILYCTCCAR